MHQQQNADSHGACQWIKRHFVFHSSAVYPSPDSSDRHCIMSSLILLTLLLIELLHPSNAFTSFPEQTLRGPFTTFDESGMRIVEGWKLNGQAAFHENFLRLTNDRQSRRGSLWSTSKMDRDEWSATLRFRVSGQGRKLFGDGLGVWFTDKASYVEGSLHGTTNSFKGFGIILDT